jgi:Flp pilus assembly protein TadD
MIRQFIRISLPATLFVTLAACQSTGDDAVQDAMKEVNVIDESNLNDVMLTVADPNEAVTYFERSVRSDPSRIDLLRGLGKSLIRAARASEALPIWKAVVEHPEATLEDKISYADALIRNNEWDMAEEILNSIPPTYETYDRYRLEAMVADSNEDWKRADSFYEIAAGLTTKPAGIYNNWGFSKLTRGDFTGAEKKFWEALRQDPNLFTAKNNLVLARGAQRNYELPVIRMSQVERAQLLYTLALAAVKQGDVTMAKTLLREAIDTHPQHFEAAVRSLQALEENVTN